MKQYPSILNSTGKNFREFTAYVFDKIDGSNLRFEWSKKRGWYKFGTRNHLFDESDPVFGRAIVSFTSSDPDCIGPRIVEAVRQREKNLQSIIAFAEFWGHHSFAGQHDPNDAVQLHLFDATVNKRGIMGPKEFLETFNEDFIGLREMPEFLGIRKWNREFVEQVRLGKVEGVTFEGVVGKAGSGHNLIMAKAKTRAWIDKVKALYTTDEAERIINS